MLEGAAGVKPGTWTKKGRQGFVEAKKHFGPDLNKAWWQSGNSGAVDAAMQAARAAFRNAYIPGVDPESFVQDYLVGVSPVTGNPVKPLFWHVGEKFSGIEKEKLGSGKTLPSHATRGIAWFFNLRAKSELRGNRNQQVSPDMPSGKPRRELEKGDASNVLFEALREQHNPVADRIRLRLRELLPNTVQGEIFALYLDKIEGTSRVPTGGGGADPQGIVKELAADLGKAPTQISKALKDMKKHVVEKGRRDTKLLKLIDSLTSKDDLGYGQRYASSAAGSCLAFWGKAEEAFLAGSRGKRAAEEIPLDQLPLQDLRFVKQFGVPEVAFDGIHGRIVSVRSRSRGVRWSKDQLKMLASYKPLRWMEVDKDSISFGLT